MKILLKAFTVIIITVFPAMLFGKSADNIRTNTCPDNLKSALIAIKKNLNSKKWINMDLKSCPHIQSEIIETVDKIMDSTECENYLALMDQKTMRIVRNSFLARKGFRFEDAALQKHFTGYNWYKPVENVQVVLAENENQKVRLLKSIEEKWIGKAYTKDWEIGPQPFPPGVNISERGNKTFLTIGKDTVLDITRVVHGEGLSENYYKVHGNAAQGTVLVCSLDRDSDSRNVDKISLYSAHGSLMYSYANEKKDRITGLVQCPQWTSQRPNVLISYNNAGCCGATWDILATFDATLKPILVLNCAEPACGGTNLFSELNEGSLYLSVRSQGGYRVDKKNGAIKRINYNGSEHSASNGEYTNTWAIWSIKENGDLELIVEATETVHNQPASPASWHMINDDFYPTIALMGSSNAVPGEPPRGEVLTSVKFGNILVLYRYDRGHYGTTMIPLQ